MAKNITTAPEKGVNGTKIFLVIFAAIALAGIITASVFGVVGAIGKKPFDYEKASLNKYRKYIEISESEYKNYEVLINLDPVTDIAVQNEIIKLQYANRKSGDGKNKIGQTIKVGDTANIYYYGYTLDENGAKVPFTGGSNFSSSVTALGIGSGNMITGFELALVGKNSNDYRTMTKRTEGTVAANSLVTLSYDFVSFDGAPESGTTATIDLSEDVDAKYGEGFKDYIIGATIGEKITDPLYIDHVGTDGITRSDVYSNVKVVNVVEFSEGEPLTIEVTFPRPYTSSPALEGKTVLFDIYIVTSVSYETPEFNDEFITETLKVSADSLEEYEGTTLTEKYTAKVRADLEKTYQDNVNAAIEAALWEHLHKIVTVKKLPKADVSLFYSNYENEIYNYYNTYSSYYSSFDQAARDYLQIGSTANWKDALTENAEQAVADKLTFNYIMKLEGLTPDAATTERLYNERLGEMVDAYLTQYGIDREDYETEEEYNKEVTKYRDLILTNYGEDYILENVQYEHVMKTLRSYATLVYAE